VDPLTASQPVAAYLSNLGRALEMRSGGTGVLADLDAAVEVLPRRRWVVERTLAWITAHRRCARDYERLPESHEAMVLWAMIALMTQRLAAQEPRPD
jgi:hypothetical protein